MFDQVASQCGWPRRTTPTRSDISVHEHLGDDNFSDGDRLVGRDPALGANPQGDVLVEAWIGRWVITYSHSRVRPREAMKERGDAYRTKAVSSLLLIGRALLMNYR